MPGGNNTSTRPVSKPGQPNPVKTLKSLTTLTPVMIYQD